MTDYNSYLFTVSSGAIPERKIGLTSTKTVKHFTENTKRSNCTPGVFDQITRYFTCPYTDVKDGTVSMVTLLCSPVWLKR